MSGVLRMRTISALSLLTTAGGVPPGAMTPPHDTDSKPGTAASATVGTSGSERTRDLLVTAMPRSLPDFTYGVAATTVGTLIAICPAIASVIAGTSPL